LIFKYHCKASARRDQLNQKKRELAEQISEAQAKLKQHLSQKEREKQEWNEWFHSVKWEDGKPADPNQNPTLISSRNHHPQQVSSNDLWRRNTTSSSLI
jgi:hypothetical protein